MTPATAVVADTQILIWYVIDPDRLSADAVAALEDATAAEQPIYVSADSLVELVYAVEKATNPITEDDRQAILPERPGPFSGRRGRGFKSRRPDRERAGQRGSR
jgi:predicted nucleic acid-binding protein